MVKKFNNDLNECYNSDDDSEVEDETYKIYRRNNITKCNNDKKVKKIKNKNNMKLI
jgi:hypothetical protein